LTSTKHYMKKLKVALVIDDSLDRNDGVQQYVRSLGGWLAAQGHGVHYLTGQGTADGITVHSLSRNVAVRFNGNRLTMPLPSSSAAIKALLRREAYDVLHVQMPYSPFLAGKIIRQSAPHTAIVGTFHILPFGRLQRSGSRALGQLQKRTLRRFDAICSVSPAAQTFALSHFGIQSTVIPNMIDLTKWHSPVKPHPGRMVFLGRLVPRKGCAELIAAVGALPPELLQKTELLIAGGGPQRQKLELLSKKYGLDRVRFLGFVAEKDKAALLASAELAVFPSTGGESFGIVLIEAMAAGAGAVLGGNNPGYQSVLGAWPKALVEAQDTAAFSSQLQTLLTDTDARIRLHQGQHQAVQRYDTNVVGHEILQLYEAALLHRKQEMR
jgi:phosphatidylinositol alpha-mannosyltransferase